LQLLDFYISRNEFDPAFLVAKVDSTNGYSAIKQALYSAQDSVSLKKQEENSDVYLVINIIF
jgi:hypothetical protein